MDLVAGDSREILTATRRRTIWEALADRTRFTAFLSLGGGLDPDLARPLLRGRRNVTGSGDPVDFIDARRELDEPVDTGERTIERVDEGWVGAVGRIGDQRRRPGRRALDRPARRGVRRPARARRSPGSASSPRTSSPSPGPPIAPPTCCSPGRCERSGPPGAGPPARRRRRPTFGTVDPLLDRLGRQRRRALGRGRAERRRQDDAPRDRRPRTCGRPRAPSRSSASGSGGSMRGSSGAGSAT